jgi:hypothetical protein
MAKVIYGGQILRGHPLWEGGWSVTIGSSTTPPKKPLGEQQGLKQETSLPNISGLPEEAPEDQKK